MCGIVGYVGHRDAMSVILPGLRRLEYRGYDSAGIATATDGHNCLAMLVRRRGENLAQFLVRLDQAIDKALTDDIYTDEINAR